MHKKRFIHYKAITILLIALIFVVSCTALLFAYRYYKLMQVNQFSKDIVLSDNYFLRSYLEFADKNGGDDAQAEPEIKGEFTCEADDLIPALEELWGRPLTDPELKIISSYDKILLGYAELEEILWELEFANATDAEYTEYPVDAASANTKDWPYETITYLQYYFERKKEEKILLEVPHLSQLPEYPNGCEAVSAVMLLQSLHFNITKEEFIADYLPKEAVKVSWGCRYGPNPKVKYAGDPASERGGWGCFAPVIVNALKQYLPKECTAKNLTGLSLEELCQTYIKKEIPVAVWVTQDFSAVSEVYQWQSYDKTQTYLYPKNQHCVVLIGYDQENYYFADPLSEESVTSHKKENVVLSYNSMGMQAVAVCKNKGNP